MASVACFIATVSSVTPPAKPSAPHSNASLKSNLLFPSPMSGGAHPRFQSLKTKATESDTNGTKATESSLNKGTKVNSIVCADCDGNGAKLCTQCEGTGVNSVDHFNGQFKAGGMCWLCRGKREILCGNCNGAGFLGGFMSTFDETMDGDQTPERPSSSPSPLQTTKVRRWRWWLVVALNVVFLLSVATLLGRLYYNEGSSSKWRRRRWAWWQVARRGTCGGRWRATGRTAVGVEEVASVRIVGLVFVVGTLGLPLVPVVAVVFFHDKMEGVKIIATLIANWGFASYIFTLPAVSRRQEGSSHENGEEIT